MSLPQYAASARELDELDLVASGALPGPVRWATDDAAVIDPEGAPVADLVAGRVENWTGFVHRPFHRLYLTPEQARSAYAGRTFVAVSAPLSEAQLRQLALTKGAVVLALVGTGTASVATIRSVIPGTPVVAVPLPADADAADRATVIAAYTDDPVELDGASAPVEGNGGLVVFFTGFSGSGKSTLARALVDQLLESGHTVTSLDGDIVRRNLSAGLTFSPEDRETNIRRIGWVAAEIARHGGIAVCSPIAPYDRTRKAVRAMVEEAGGRFVLIHVATPIEECERRDRKGLYAKARAGEIPDFTGISAPYEEPEDADVRIDTTGLSIEEALEPVAEAVHAPTASTTDPRGPLKVLFVCTANICRSPFMELTARALAPELTISSAGTHGFTAAPMESEMAAVLAEGIDPGEFRSRPLTVDMLAEADLVLTAQASHRSYILDDHPAYFTKVLTLGQAAEAISRSETTGRALVAELARTRGASDPALDVDDPYRKGPVAARAAADQISSLVAAIVPRLRE
ncbi:hypothetical protein Back2_13610 [Nocardioides baekrokdamisoli]|uniref:Adenylyl-sulfate kinase n=1 Tax=Nocardioides baekrokdamisoli TaxID=1804624 RepID=A0A3G9J0S9_9ACTN|nr:adenylyl-sulfate kinase [Nocardioides baekrokdamisoli]BBH17074.1 hypothetical protein Back2_13610 [Nocardioides baekrokdamisoli]